MKVHLNLQTAALILYHIVFSSFHFTSVTPNILLKIFLSKVLLLLFIINILTAIGLAPGGSSPVHIYREHYIEYTNNTQNT